MFQTWGDENSLGLSGWQRRQQRGYSDEQDRSQGGRATVGPDRRDECVKAPDERDSLMGGSSRDKNQGEAVTGHQYANVGGRPDRSADMLRQMSGGMFRNLILPGAVGLNQPSGADAIYQAPETDSPPPMTEDCGDVPYDVPGRPLPVREGQGIDDKPVIPAKRRGKKAVDVGLISSIVGSGARRVDPRQANKQILPKEDLTVEQIRLEPIPRRSRRLKPAEVTEGGEDIQDILQPLRQPERNMDPPGGVWLAAVPPAPNPDVQKNVPLKPPIVDPSAVLQLAANVVVGAVPGEVPVVEPPVGFREPTGGVQSITITPQLGRRFAGGTRFNPVINVPSSVFNEAVRNLHGSVAGS